VDLEHLEDLGYLVGPDVLENQSDPEHLEHLEDLLDLDYLVVLDYLGDLEILVYLDYPVVLGYPGDLDFPVSLDYLGILVVLNLEVLGYLAVHFDLDYLEDLAILEHLVDH
jgi:hypothetical protein